MHFMTFDVIHGAVEEESRIYKRTIAKSPKYGTERSSLFSASFIAQWTSPM
jgi:hypothetical protein